VVILSLLVIVFSGVLLAAGIISGDDLMVVGSIILSLIAAVVLFAGVWRQRGSRDDESEQGQEEFDPPAGEASQAVDDWRQAYAPDIETPASPGASKPQGPLSSPIGELTGDHALNSPHIPDFHDDYDPGQPPGQELESVMSADPATRARSAVASMSKRPVDESEDLIMQDRRGGVSDAATAIPQLMSAAPKPTPASPTLSQPDAGPAAAPPTAPTAEPKVPEPKVVSPPPVSTPTSPPGRTQARASIPMSSDTPSPPETASSTSSEFGTYGSTQPAQSRREAEPFASSTGSFAAARVPTTERTTPEAVPPKSFGPDRFEPARQAFAPTSSVAEDRVTESPLPLPLPPPPPAAPPPPAVVHEPVPEARSTPTEPEPVDVEDEYVDPTDEPPAELLLSYEERQLRDCDAEVFVVDGRPRFHLAGCLHLADKQGEPLVLSEAAELGFTSCSLCTAATTSLAARH
jgi:hypothetical protein